MKQIIYDYISSGYFKNKYLVLSKECYIDDEARVNTSNMFCGIYEDGLYLGRLNEEIFNSLEIRDKQNKI